MSEAEFNVGHAAITPRDLEALHSVGVVNSRLTLAGLAALRCMLCHARSGKPTTVLSISECAGVARLTTDNRLRELKEGGYVVQRETTHRYWQLMPAPTLNGEALAEVARPILPPVECAEAQVVVPFDRPQRGVAHG